MLVKPRKMHSIWDSAHIVALEFAPDVLEGLKDRLLFQGAHTHCRLGVCSRLFGRSERSSVVSRSSETVSFPHQLAGTSRRKLEFHGWCVPACLCACGPACLRACVHARLHFVVFGNRAAKYTQKLILFRWIS